MTVRGAGRGQDVAYANRAKAGTDKSMKLPGRHWQARPNTPPPLRSPSLPLPGNAGSLRDPLAPLYE